MGSYQSVAMQGAASSMQGGAMVAGANIQASQLQGDATMMLLQREQEQLDLYYKSKSLGIDADILATDIELLGVQAKEKEAIRLKQLNETQSMLAVKAAAQNRSGGTVQNLEQRRVAEAQRDIMKIESQTRYQQSNVQSQRAKVQSEAQLANLSIGSSKIASKYEQSIAGIQADYTKKSAAITAQGMAKQASIASRGALIGAVSNLAIGGLTSYAQYKSIK